MNMTERRGLNRQQAIDYLGVKPRYFEERIRPKLTGMRLGTSVVFDRLDLDRIFDEIKRENRDGQPNEKGEKTWARDSRESTSPQTAPGSSTRSFEAYDFKAASARIKRQKTG